MSSNIILPFDSPAASLARAGGKGANLAAMVRAGFGDRVPHGFIVAVEAYRTFVEAIGIRAQVLELARRVVPDDPRSLDETSSAIRALFDRAAIPPDLASAIAHAYQELPSFPTTQPPDHPTTQPPDRPVAVRSSATAEDLPGLSFAGQQETYLNVVGDAAVLDAVRRCWASLWTARAIGYRARNRIPPDEVALAVVVQAMVEPESSGVLFTANPISGRRDEMVIDGSFGLGEAIVAGQVEPDHYVINSREWRITQRRLGAKAVQIVSRSGGGVERLPRGEAGALEQALPDAQILELARLAHRLSAHFGSPQDIEWALSRGRLFLLQSRPITALYPLPEAPPDPDGTRVYVSLNAIQGVAEPITPLGIESLQVLFGGLLRVLGSPTPGREIFVPAGGRLFINVTGPAHDPRLRHALLGGLSRAEPAARQVLLLLIEGGRIPERHLLTPRRALQLLRAVVPLVALGFRAILVPERAVPDATDSVARRLAMLRARAASARDLRSRLDFIAESLSRGALEFAAPIFPLVIPGMAALTVVDEWLRDWLGLPPGTTLKLVRGLPGNVTTEMDLRLWSVAQTIRADPESRATFTARPAQEIAGLYRRGELPPAAQRAFAEFLSAYGMRAHGEIDIGRPRWHEDPIALIHTLQAYLANDDPELAPDAAFRRGASESEQMAADLVERVRRTRFGLLRARLLAMAIRRMRQLSGLRETPKFHLVQLLDLCRTALLDSARNLADRGRLERPEDVFFLSYDHLRRVAEGDDLDLKPLVSAARSAHDRELGRRQMPHLLLSTGETFYAGPPGEGESESDLIGEAVSPGVAEGTARVVFDPAGVRLEPREILVCPGTDPGWTPLFLTAGGLVMEIGGLVTHGSVVAREYGLPAVVGVRAATSRLATGMRLRVDGNRGRVTILP